MSTNILSSILLDMRVERPATLPKDIGHLCHALVHSVIGRVDPDCSAQWHDQTNERPFTISLLTPSSVQNEYIALHRGQNVQFRVTLLDGVICSRLIAYLAESGPLSVRLGKSKLSLRRILSTPAAAYPNGWIGVTSWQALAVLPAKRFVTMHFVSPTAFSLGNRVFGLFPKPQWLWESLLRVWNRHAPQQLRMEPHILREMIANRVTVTQCDLFTQQLRFPKFVQKGFCGTCTYALDGEDCLGASYLTTLAAFAYYAGVGYKTTMGMGQARAEFPEEGQRDVLTREENAE